MRTTTLTNTITTTNNFIHSQFYGEHSSLSECPISSSSSQWHIQQTTQLPTDYAQLHSTYVNSLPDKQEVEDHYCPSFQASNYACQQEEHMDCLRDLYSIKDQTNLLLAPYEHHQQQHGEHSQQLLPSHTIQSISQDEPKKDNLSHLYPPHELQRNQSIDMLFPCTQLPSLNRNPSLTYPQHDSHIASLNQHPSEAVMDSLCRIEKNESGQHEKNTENMCFSGQQQVLNNSPFDKNPLEISCFQPQENPNTKEERRSGIEQEILRDIEFDEKLKALSCQEELMHLGYEDPFCHETQKDQDFSIIQMIAKGNEEVPADREVDGCGRFEKLEKMSETRENEENLKENTKNDQIKLSEEQFFERNYQNNEEIQIQKEEETCQGSMPNHTCENEALHDNQLEFKSANDSLKIALRPNTQQEQNDSRTFSNLDQQSTQMLPQKQISLKIPFNYTKQWIYTQNEQYQKREEQTFQQYAPILQDRNQDGGSYFVENYNSCQPLGEQNGQLQGSICNQIADSRYSLEQIREVFPAQREIQRVNNTDRLAGYYHDQSISAWNHQNLIQPYETQMEQFHCFDGQQVVPQQQYQPLQNQQSFYYNHNAGQFYSNSQQILPNNSAVNYEPLPQQLYANYPQYSAGNGNIVSHNSNAPYQGPEFFLSQEKKEEESGEYGNNDYYYEADLNAFDDRKQEEQSSSNEKQTLLQNLQEDQNRPREGSSENTSILTAEQQECVNELQNHKKKNVAKNIMTAFKNFMANPRKFGYTQEQIEMALAEYNLTKKADETFEEMQGKFLKYIVKKKFNHYTIKLLIQHPNYGLVFEFFLKSLSEFWLDQSKVHDLRAHQAMITFLKQAFVDIEIIQELKKYDKRKH